MSEIVEQKFKEWTKGKNLKDTRTVRWTPSLEQDRGYIKIEFRYPQ